jgi:tight adherence protein B
MSAVVSLAAALCIGVFCYCAAGFLVGRPPRLQRWRRGTTGVSGEQLWLAQAGLAVTPVQFWAASALVGVAALVVCTLVTGTVLVAVVPALAAASMPRAFYGRRRSERLRAVQAAWPDALRDLLASIAAGRSLHGALVELSSSGPDSLRYAFARFGAHARMLGTVPALEVIREELADPTSDRVIEVLIIASQRGGPIVKDILEDLVVATTKDLKVLEEIDTEGLEMRINARAVLVLPWFVLVALTIRGGAFRDFYASGAGLLVVVAGGVLSAIGSVWIRHLGRLQQERRVLGGARVGPGDTR